MGNGKFSIDRVKIVPVWIDLFIVNGDQNVSFFNAGFRGRATLIDLIDVNSAIGILELQITAKLRIAGGGEAEAGARKAFIWVVLRFDQEMFDHRAGDRIDGLGSAIVPHQKRGQLDSPLTIGSVKLFSRNCSGQLIRNIR